MATSTGVSLQDLIAQLAAMGSDPRELASRVEMEFMSDGVSPHTAAFVLLRAAEFEGSGERSPDFGPGMLAKAIEALLGRYGSEAATEFEMNFRVARVMRRQRAARRTGT